MMPIESRGTNRTHYVAIMRPDNALSSRDLKGSAA